MNSEAHKLLLHRLQTLLQINLDQHQSIRASDNRPMAQSNKFAAGRLFIYKSHGACVVKYKVTVDDTMSHMNKQSSTQ